MGSRIRRLKVGDRVYGYSWINPKDGFYAEYVVVAAENVAHVPQGFDMEHGAMATTGLTALQGIDDALKLKKGENVIIHGASGGVGTLALQFAKLRGARVLATASGNDGVALVRRLGADTAIDGLHGDIQRSGTEVRARRTRRSARNRWRRTARKVHRCAQKRRAGGISEWSGA